jgi:RNA polymerase sigma-70 factor (ECF subfamily)
MRVVNATNPDDPQLLEEMSSGSTIAFDAIYGKYWALVYTAAYKRLQDESAAKDITQDIFLQLWLRRQELSIGNLKAYLLTATRNNVLKRMEKYNRLVAVPELILQLKAAQTGADAALMEKEFMRLYETMIQSLTPSQQQIFHMRFRDDLSTDQIAEQLNITRKTVQNQLGKSINQLRESMLFIAVLLLMK